jgi:hypothetical protein
MINSYLTPSRGCIKMSYRETFYIAVTQIQDFETFIRVIL